MAGTITITNIRYGPNPFFPETGGTAYFKFDVNFDGAPPPAQFVYAVDLIDRNGTTVRTLSGTRDYPQQAGNFVALRWDGKDDGGTTVPLNGGYGPTFRVSVPATKSLASKDLAASYTEKSMKFCSGVQCGSNAPPCECCD
jgi:flagellar hook assembly protein FlgD